jgi:two-component system, OmpR family, sensor histidine kinase MtrB
VLHVRSLRFRVAATFILGTLVVSGIVAGATYYLIRQRMIDGRIDASLRQSFKAMRILKEEVVRAGDEGILPAELRTRVQQRNDVVIIVPAARAVESSSVNFEEDDIPPSLIRSVRSGRVAYTFDPERPRIIFGSRIPESRGAGTGEAYFAYSTQKVARTLNQLSKIFLGVIGAAALAAGAVGMRLAAATIRPLRLAAEAARRVADGNLETRLDVSGEDELGRLANAFNEMTHALEERIARERRFVADVSHELRTPLTSLKTSIDFLAQRTDDIPEKFRGALGLASEEVRSLQRLVDDLLELSRVDAGGVMVDREDVDLVNFAHELARRRAPGANVLVTGPDELVIKTDKMRLERVVGNLLENAVFHGGEGSVRIDLEQSNGTARIAVSDEGPGIDSDKLQMIFQRFWRGDSSRQRDGRIGAGLGLSIARENANVIGAEIAVESEPGRGTCFEVTLPSHEPV